MDIMIVECSSPKSVWCVICVAWPAVSPTECMHGIQCLAIQELHEASNIDELGVMLAVDLMRSLFLGITHVLGLQRIAPSTAHMGRACTMFCSQLAQGHLYGLMADA